MRSCRKNHRRIQAYSSCLICGALNTLNLPADLRFSQKKADVHEQIIKGFALGMSMACQIQLIYHLSHKGLESTTQTLIGSISSVMTIIVAAFGGYALEAMGLRPFFGLISILQAVAGSVLFAGFAVESTILKKKLPEGI